MRLLRSATILVVGALAFSTVAAQASPTILFDLDSGKVLAHREAFKRWHPASLTKLMTAYVTFRAVQAGELALDSPIKVTRRAAAEPPAKMGYKAGSEMTLDNALKMMLIKSANDIAYAVGENVGGSVEAFALRMNAEARRLGMTGSNFVNPNGLHSADQYTTAHDLALLVMALRKEFPQYRHYYGIEGLAAGKKTLATYNMLIGRYQGADGMKTGFICASGFNMIASATRDGRTMVSVVLGEKSAVSRANVAASLLDRGFANPDIGKTTVAELAPYGTDNDVAKDMRAEICEKKPAEAASEAAPSEAAPSEATPPGKSPWQAPLDHQRVLVAVGLGGATGPTPKAMVGVEVAEFADVPLPTWRPDMPPPPGASPAAAQGG